MDFISRQAVLEMITSQLKFAHMTEDERQSYEAFGRAVEQMPPVEPTIYGFNINHLALIAWQMEEKGITADEAVKIFTDASAVAAMVIEEQRRHIEESVKQWMI